MAGRPRTVSDDAIMAGAARAIGRLGPARLTLADVATEAGLAPATLVQRFGSKRGLLLAFAAQAAAGVAAAFTRAGAARPSPIGALVDVLIDMTRDIATPEALANHLAFLQIDLSDPEFHRHALNHAREVRAGIRRLLDAAVEAGELAPGDTERLARAIQATFNGALVTWAVFRTGSVADWVRDDLETLLRPLAEASPPDPSDDRMDRPQHC